jgi:hypothetical protein
VTADRLDAYDLTRELTVWRSTRADDGQGGQDETFGQTGTVRAKVNQPTAAERVEGMRAGVDLMFGIHFLPDADVQRGDELRDDTAGEVFRVVSTVYPSTRVYLRAECTRDQYEPA